MLMGVGMLTGMAAPGVPQDSKSSEKMMSVFMSHTCQAGPGSLGWAVALPV